MNILLEAKHTIPYIPPYLHSIKYSNKHKSNKSEKQLHILKPKAYQDYSISKIPSPTNKTAKYTKQHLTI